MPVTSDQPSPAPRKPLAPGVNLALLCVFLLFAVLWGVLLWYRFAQTIEEGEKRADNLALILSEHLRRSVNAVDAALAQIALHSARVGGAKAAPELLASVLETAQASITGVASISIADETGTIVASTLPALVAGQRRNSFLFQQMSGRPDGGLSAGAPLRTPPDGRLAIPLGRPLLGADGKYAGAVVARL